MNEWKLFQTFAHKKEVYGNSADDVSTVAIISNGTLLIGNQNGHKETYVLGALRCEENETNLEFRPIFETGPFAYERFFLSFKEKSELSQAASNVGQFIRRPLEDLYTISKEMLGRGKDTAETIMRWLRQVWLGRTKTFRLLWMYSAMKRIHIL